MDEIRREGERIALGGLRDALVMMVDDDPLVIDLTQAFLEKAGYRRFVSTSDASAVLTSADDPETRLRALDLGASDFLRKPVDPSELALRLRNTLAAKAHREAIRKAFVRYVSPRLAEGIINDTGAPFASPPQRAEMVALFADLRGFTRITETIGVEHVVDMLNEYFTVLTEAAYQHDGTIFRIYSIRP